MIGTLLKHQWLQMRRQLGALLVISTGMVLVGGLFAAIGMGLLSEIAALGGMIGIALVYAGSMILTVVHYWRSGYGRQGYFTQVIPTKGGTIYAARLLWSALITLASIPIMAVMWLILLTGLTLPFQGFVSPIDRVGQFWNAVLAMEFTGIHIVLILGLILLVTMALVPYFFAISIGHETFLSRFRAGGPVLAYLALGMVANVLVMVAIFAVPYGVTMTGEVSIVSFSAWNDLVSGTSSDVMPLGFVPVLAALFAFCIWRTARSWNKRVNLA